MAARPSSRMAAVAAAFFASGVAALVYQVAWQRILALETGVGIYSIALIVAAFMAGLGVGSELGGRLSAAPRPRAARSWPVRRASSSSSALFGLASATFYYDWLYVRLRRAAARRRGGGAAATSSPSASPRPSWGCRCRSSCARRWSRGGRARGPSACSTASTSLGAAVGALLTPWVLMRLFGLAGALLVAAAGEPRRRRAGARRRPRGDGARHRRGPVGGGRRAARVRCGAVARPLRALRLLRPRPRDRVVPHHRRDGQGHRVHLRERARGVPRGHGRGDLRRRGHRAPHPRGRWPPSSSCQAAILAYAAGARGGGRGLPADHPLLAWIVRTGARTAVLRARGALGPGDVLRLYGLVPSSSTAIPTVLMGLFVHRPPARGPGRSAHQRPQGRPAAGGQHRGLRRGQPASSGWARSTGSAARARCALLAAVGAVVALVGAARRAPAAFVVPAVALARPGGVAARRNEAHLAAAPRRSRTDVLVDEDATRRRRDRARRRRRLAHVRERPQPQHAALRRPPHDARRGARDRPSRAAARGRGGPRLRRHRVGGGLPRETALVRVFEICAPEQRLLRRLAAAGAGPRLSAFLDDPRLDSSWPTAATRSSAEGESYDVIEMDALPPSSPYSGTSTRVEFFRLCRRRLPPAG